MRKLPLLISVPHGGTAVPGEVSEYCALSVDEIVADGDEGALDIYGPLANRVDALVSTDVARAVVDMNRAPDDFRKDGVVKTHTCWDVPVYRTAPPRALLERLVATHHGDYHQRLEALGRSGRFRLGVDCHTMAAAGPPVGPDPGVERPMVCLSDADGTCPPAFTERLAAALASAFAPHAVRVNSPFRGGYIIRRHAAEMPWLQLELSRSPALCADDKRARVLTALRALCEWLEPTA